jgi:DNA-binding NtrC family response regulator
VRAQNFLRNHTWHGNIRELKNLVQRLLILGAGDDITQDEVEAALGSVGLALESGARFPVSFDQPLRQAREAFEKAYLEYQLEKHTGNVSQIATESGMERTHLYRKLKALGIDVKDKR